MRRVNEWSSNGWTKTNGRKVQNIMLWKLLQMFLHPQVTVTHVCKTTAVPGNTLAQRSELRNALRSYRPATTSHCPTPSMSLPLQGGVKVDTIDNGS